MQFFPASVFSGTLYLALLTVSVFILKLILKLISLGKFTHSNMPPAASAFGVRVVWHLQILLLLLSFYYYYFQKNVHS